MTLSLGGGIPQQKEGETWPEVAKHWIKTQHQSICASNSDVTNSACFTDVWIRAEERHKVVSFRKVTYFTFFFAIFVRLILTLQKKIEFTTGWNVSSIENANKLFFDVSLFALQTLHMKKVSGIEWESRNPTPSSPSIRREQQRFLRTATQDTWAKMLH